MSNLKKSWSILNKISVTNTLTCEQLSTRRKTDFIYILKPTKKITCLQFVFACDTERNVIEEKVTVTARGIQLNC